MLSLARTCAQRLDGIVKLEDGKVLLYAEGETKFSIDKMVMSRIAEGDEVELPRHIVEVCDEIGDGGGGGEEDSGASAPSAGRQQPQQAQPRGGFRSAAPGSLGPIHRRQQPQKAPPQQQHQPPQQQHHQPTKKKSSKPQPQPASGFPVGRQPRRRPRSRTEILDILGWHQPAAPAAAAPAAAAPAPAAAPARAGFKRPRQVGDSDTSAHVRSSKPTSTSSSFVPPRQIAFPPPAATVRASKPPAKKAAPSRPLVALGDSLRSVHLPSCAASVVPSATRTVSIDTAFDTWQSYRHAFVTASIEEINLVLHGLAHDLRQILVRHAPPSASASIRCPHGPAALKTVRKPGANHGRMFYACAKPGKSSDCRFFEWADAKQCAADAASTLADFAPHPRSLPKLVADARAAGVPLYSDCSFSVARGPQPRYFLKLSGVEHSSAYAAEDLWIVSSSPTFEKRAANDILVFCVASFHGPSSSDSLAVRPLHGGSPIAKAQNRDLFAIRGPNVGIELRQIQALESANPSRDLPLLPTLLGGTAGRSSPAPPLLSGVDGEDEGIADACAAASSKFRLNNDQARVLDVMRAWLTEPCPESFLLVHGAFGAGKSYSLIAGVLLLCQAMQMHSAAVPQADETKPSSNRVLVCTATNNAVDRVLLGLLDAGFSDFVRVGSVRRMNARILPYAVGNLGMDSDDAKAATETKRELQQMLKEASTPSERRLVEKALVELRTGIMAKRAAKVREYSVVGCTSAAAGFQILADCTFPVVVVDEATQMIEPTAVYLLARFRASRAILAGDPCQLQPVLSHASAASSADLRRSLFSRLAASGIEPILLRTQYRCHPQIAAISNALFYNGRLLDGTSAESRPPLVPAMPPVFACDVSSGSETLAGHSFENRLEAECIAHCLGLLHAHVLQHPTTTENDEEEEEEAVAAGEDDDESDDESDDDAEFDDGPKPRGKRTKREPETIGPSIGVIVFYKAQIEAIERVLAAKAPAALAALDIQVATVDSFQGREKDIILVSCVRSGAVMGHSAEPERVNVAVTRARHHLGIFGSRKTMSTSPLWRDVLQRVAGPGRRALCHEGLLMAASMAELFQ